MDALAAVIALTAVALAFAVSASAGLGGSLVLVPALAFALGTKEGVALAALLLAGNNIAKALAYRATLPVRASLGVVVLTAAGALLGARLLVAAPDAAVSVAVVVSFVAAMLLERWGRRRVQRSTGALLAFSSGATSGFSGTSGPLKGVAIRSLGLDRAHFVGAASLSSLFGDASKALVYAQADLLGRAEVTMLLAAVPLMLVATLAGRRVNRSIGERGYTALFWTVMGGYTARLLMPLL